MAVCGLEVNDRNPEEHSNLAHKSQPTDHHNVYCAVRPTESVINFIAVSSKYLNFDFGAAV